MQELIQRLRKVGTGIGLIYAALLLSVLSGFIVGISPMFITADAAQNVAAQFKNQQRKGQNPFAVLANQPNPVDVVKVLKGPALFLMTSGLLLAIVAAIMDLSGRFLCLAVPKECAGASYLQVSLAIVGVGIVVTLWSLLGTLGVMPNPPAMLSWIFALLNLVASILFMIFLRLLAEYIHRDDLAAAARSVLNFAIVLFVCVVGVVAVTFILAVIMPPLALLGFLGMLVLLIMAIVLLVRYLTLLSSLRAALHAYSDALDQDQLEIKPAPR